MKKRFGKWVTSLMNMIFKENEMSLKELREKKKLSQSQLAEKSGVNVRMIQHYEQGVKDISRAQLKTAIALADALKVHPKKLLE